MTDAQQMIIAQEGTGPMRNGRFFLYDDATGQEIKKGSTVVGYPTFGYGHNVQAKGVSLDLVFMQLNSDIADAIEDIRHHFSCYDQLSRPRQLVLISMALNLGRERLGGFVHFISAVHRGDWEESANQILDSDAARNDPHRYQPLAKMMRDNSSEWT